MVGSHSRASRCGILIHVRYCQECASQYSTPTGWQLGSGHWADGISWCTSAGRTGAAAAASSTNTKQGSVNASFLNSGLVVSVGASVQDGQVLLQPRFVPKKSRRCDMSRPVCLPLRTCRALVSCWLQYSVNISLATADPIRKVAS